MLIKINPYLIVVSAIITNHKLIKNNQLVRLLASITHQMFKMVDFKQQLYLIISNS